MVLFAEFIHFFFKRFIVFENVIEPFATHGLVEILAQITCAAGCHGKKLSNLNLIVFLSKF